MSELTLADYVLTPDQFRRLHSMLMSNMGQPDELHDAIFAASFPCDVEAAAQIANVCGFACDLETATSWCADDANGVEVIDGERRLTLGNIGELCCHLLTEGMITSVVMQRIAEGRTAEDELAATATKLSRELQTRAVNRNLN